MVKVIHNIQYSTQTAKLMAHWDNGWQSTEDLYCAENLHRTKMGHYFLHCLGGSLSQYGVYSQGHASYGEMIQPLSDAQARAWGERQLGKDEYERAFQMVAIPDLTHLTAQVPVHVKQQLDAMKAQTGKTMAALVAEAIASYAVTILPPSKDTEDI